MSQQTINCQSCDTENPANDKFCGRCGTPLYIPKVKCQNCGDENLSTKNFCGNCGTALDRFSQTANHQSATHPKSKATEQIESRMFCSNCGTQIPDEANFCWKCGGPRREGTRTNEIKQVSEPKYEMGEIVLIEGKISSWRNQRQYRFALEAIGIKGRYTALESEMFTASTVNPGPQGLPVLDSLIANLVQLAWEPIESRKEKWWQYKFRRRVD